MGGARRALLAFAEAGIHLVLSGHVHRSYSVRGLGAAGFPVIVQASTTTSVRLRGEANGYNRIEIEADGLIRIEHRIWQGDGWAASPPDPAGAEYRVPSAGRVSLTGHSTPEAAPR